MFAQTHSTKEIFWVVFLSLTSTCSTKPSQIQADVHIVQENLPIRPQDDVTLSCILTGAASTQVEFYWWLIEETNTPIYIYSEKFQISEISEESKHWVLNETREIFENRIISKLQLNANASENHKIKCEFNMKNRDICGTSMTVIFAGPNLSIEIDENLTTKREDSRIAQDVFCCVDTAIGIPKFTLSCLGCLSDGFEIVQQNTAIEGHDNYLYGIHHAVVHLPITGILSCNVTDNLGTYVVTQTIGDQDIPEQDHYSCGCVNIPAMITIMFFSILLNIVLVYSIISKKKKNDMRKPRVK